VLVDFHMPRVDGIKAVQKLREIDNFVPIVVLTVDERQEIVDRFIKAGADDFALKPIRAPDLISRIKVHLKQKQRMHLTADPQDEYVKGISKETMDIIVKFLREARDFVTMSQISRETGLAYQTVHRYLQYLMDAKRIEIRQEYGKQGRPTQRYRLL